MTIFSRISKDDEPYRSFTVKLLFPKIGKLDVYNEWSDEKYNGFELDFKTTLRYCHTDYHKQFDLILFGFGVRISKQDGY